MFLTFMSSIALSKVLHIQEYFLVNIVTYINKLFKAKLVSLGNNMIPYI